MGLSLTNLISHWKLDESSGSRADSHGTNTLTDDSSVGSTTGIVGSAANFVAASSDSLSRADNTDLRLSGTDASITLWVKLTSKTAESMLVSKWNSGFDLEYGITYQQSTDRFRFAVGNGSANFIVLANTFGSPSTGVWYFLQARIDNTAKTIEICVNNTGWDSTSFTGTVKNGTNTFYVGRRVPGASPNYADAAIDEVSIWKRKLTDDEFSFLYNGGSGRSYPWQPEYKYPSLRNAVAGYMAGRDTGSAASDQFTADGTQDGTLTNGVTRAGSPLAYSFDGVDDYISIADATIFTPTDGFTLSCWINITSIVSGYRPIIGKYNGSTAYEWAMFLVDGKPQISMWSTTGINRVSRRYNTALSTGVWYHLCCTAANNGTSGRYVNSGLKVYLNGTQVDDTNDDLSSPANVSNTTSGIGIGANAVGGNVFNGLIDDVLIYPRVLTPTEIGYLASARGAAYQQTGTRRRRSSIGAGIL